VILPPNQFSVIGIAKNITMEYSTLSVNVQSNDLNQTALMGTNCQYLVIEQCELNFVAEAKTVSAVALSLCGKMLLLQTNVTGELLGDNIVSFLYAGLNSTIKIIGVISTVKLVPTVSSPSGVVINNMLTCIVIISDSNILGVRIDKDST
jgi:hypothetical protein